MVKDTAEQHSYDFTSFKNCSFPKDIILTSDGGSYEFKSYKILVHQLSPVFKTMLGCDNGLEKLRLTGISKEGLQTLESVIYMKDAHRRTKKFKKTNPLLRDMESLFLLHAKYEIPILERFLVNVCSQNLWKTNHIDMLRTVRSYQLHKVADALEKRLKRCCCSKHSAFGLVLDQFVQLDETLVMHLIKISNWENMPTKRPLAKIHSWQRKNDAEKKIADALMTQFKSLPSNVMYFLLETLLNIDTIHEEVRRKDEQYLQKKRKASNSDVCA